MSKYRLEKESGGFAVVNEHREFRAGSIRTEYRVEDPYGDEIAVVRSMDEALAVLGNHLAVTPAPWEDGGAGRYLKSTHDYFDTLLVEQISAESVKPACSGATTPSIARVTDTSS